MGGRGSAGRAHHASNGDDNTAAGVAHDEAHEAASNAPEPGSSDSQDTPEVLAYRMSDAPLAINSYDNRAQGDPTIDYHEDGEVGTALQMMGGDRHLDVDGEPLYNVLGRIATRGRWEPQQALDDLKALHARLPEESQAKATVGTALWKLDAPDNPPPQLPDGAPEPLRRLVTELWAVPAVRRSEPGREGERLTRLIEEWKAGQLRGPSLVRAVGNLDARHESAMGWDAIRQVQGRAMDEITQLMRTEGRRAVDPPT